MDYKDINRKRSHSPVRLHSIKSSKLKQCFTSYFFSEKYKASNKLINLNRRHIFQNICLSMNLH